jgi:molecular chaperone DnaK (HSP70)
VQANDVQHVIRTGGSSSIPVFIDMLAGLFGRDRIVEENLFTGVAAGLAVRAEMGIRD